MTDRIPTYPGRYKATNVSTGEITFFDLELADEPTQAGTPLNKASLLTDATAATVGANYGTTPSLPTEALNIIASGASRTEIQTYVGDGIAGSSHKTSLTFSHEPKLVMIFAGSTNNSVDIGDYSAVLPWASIKRVYQDYPSAATFRLFSLNYSNTYTLSNGNKTIAWYGTGAANQLNSNGVEYTAIAFY